ncbi:hypothetical protein DFH08DRAFT_826839 [Mycena albidolilacea]|uniref:Uncharacterized protein n=1 Tax=Mycena albidolilacea TaxID=1033008 RepID=A0AAD6YZI9_9AGAR|nr:hypothetical protein DFH08DRAFT_826839 [Mycena albidolilacea]
MACLVAYSAGQLTATTTSLEQGEELAIILACVPQTLPSNLSLNILSPLDTKRTTARWDTSRPASFCVLSVLSRSGSRINEDLLPLFPVVSTAQARIQHGQLHVQIIASLCPVQRMRCSSPRGKGRGGTHMLEYTEYGFTQCTIAAIPVLPRPMIARDGGGVCRANIAVHLLAPAPLVALQ